MVVILYHHYSPRRSIKSCLFYAMMTCDWWCDCEWRWMPTALHTHPAQLIWWAPGIRYYQIRATEPNCNSMLPSGESRYCFAPATRMNGECDVSWWLWWIASWLRTKKIRLWTKLHPQFCEIWTIVGHSLDLARTTGHHVWSDCWRPLFQVRLPRNWFEIDSEGLDRGGFKRAWWGIESWKIPSIEKIEPGQ